MTVAIQTFFNFRSPYCYLASRRMWALEEDFDARIDFRPLPGWRGRSAPERAKVKLPISRQDVQRWCRRLDLPFVPPPKSTDPTNAGALAHLAMEEGKLRPYVVAVMAKEWGEGQDIGRPEVLAEVAAAIGLTGDVSAALENPAYREALEGNAAEAAAQGLFGVPTFVIGDQIFWGQDRIDFVAEHLEELGAGR